MAKALRLLDELGPGYGIRQVGELLNEYITAGRYPADLAFEEIGLSEAQEASQATREIRDAIIE